MIQAIAPKFLGLMLLCMLLVSGGVFQEGARRCPCIHWRSTFSHRYIVSVFLGPKVSHSFIAITDKLDLGQSIIFLGLDMQSDGSVDHFQRQRTVWLIRDFKVDKMQLLHKASTLYSSC